MVLSALCEYNVEIEKQNLNYKNWKRDKNMQPKRQKTNTRRKGHSWAQAETCVHAYINVNCVFINKYNKDKYKKI